MRATGHAVASETLLIYSRTWSITVAAKEDSFLATRNTYLYFVNIHVHARNICAIKNDETTLIRE